jgi:pimeloyl-[acyl-carrier protein] methyl ester esterase
MRLVFVPGWAFGPESFDALAPLLTDYPQTRVDLGFFGAARIPAFAPGDVLIGHSMGFSWGLSQNPAWAGAVAINGFSRFTLENGRGCVRPAELRALRKALARDPRSCVNDFRARHGAGPAPGAIQVEALAAGLEFLETYDASPQSRHCERSEAIHPAKRRIVDGFAPLAMTASEEQPTIPILVLAAQDDPLVPLDASQELAQTGGEWAASPRGGHGLPWTAPEFCAKKIRDFLRRHGV